MLTNPYLTLKEVSGKLFINDVESEENFEDVLNKYLEENHEANYTGLPIISGGIGYFSYDYGRKFENIYSRHTNKIETPDAIICFYENYIIEDIREKTIYITSKSEKGLEKIKEVIQDDNKVAPKCDSEKFSINSNFSKENYITAIENMINYIIEGDIYIANMTRQLTLKSNNKPYSVFRYLRPHNPSPFGGYLNYDDFQIICASPERFIRMEDRKIETRPIKGTIKRGSTPEEDAALKETLLNSTKDKSELLMIVDLERNDLNHVCVPGTVKVTENFAIEEYSTVFHLVSNGCW